MKVNFGKYLEPTSNNNNYILSNPITRIATNTTRTWTDANSNFVAGVRPAEPAGQRRVRSAKRQHVRDGRADDCGHRPEDPHRVERAVQRLADWRVGPAADPPAGIGGSRLFRRWLNNFTVTDNLLVGPADFTEFSITAPSDPRLPDGGGYIVDGLYELAQNRSA